MGEILCPFFFFGGGVALTSGQILYCGSCTEGWCKYCKVTYTGNLKIKAGEGERGEGNAKHKFKVFVSTALSATKYL